jgi:O-acetyl-ADP-ribose deacetylase (regulator of RNase III)
VNLHLVDLDADVVEAWREAFAPFPEVAVRRGNLIAMAVHCAVSPANSHGFMDGGIDDAYRHLFGRSIELRVQDAIAALPEALLPVGASLLLRTGHELVPWLVVAPTMESPKAVGRENAYLAMRATLRALDANPEAAREVWCPGLATGTGRVPPHEAAAEMARAYGEWRRDRAPGAPA